MSLQFDYMVDSLEKKEERLKVVEAKEKEISLLEESISGKLRVLVEKEMDFESRQVTEATLMSLAFEKQSEEVLTHLEKYENKLVSMSKHIMSEFEAKKEEARRISESVHEKLCDLEKAEKDLVLKQRADAEKWKKENESMEESRKQLEAMEKELKRKKESFELRQKEEAEKWRKEAELKNRDLDIKTNTLEEMMKELKLKQMKLDERSKQQLVNAETRKRSNLEFDPLNSYVSCLTRLAKKHKPQEADLACASVRKTDPASKHITDANDRDIKANVVRKDNSEEYPKSVTCPDAKSNDLNKSMSSSMGSI